MTSAFHIDRLLRLGVSILSLVLYVLPMAVNAGGDLDRAKKLIAQGSPAEAYYLLRPLAEDEDEEAAYLLGWMYHKGHGLIADDSEAVKWWEIAAEEDYVDSMMALGLLYLQGGVNIKADTSRSVDYFLMAADEGHEAARLKITELLLQGDMGAIRKIRKLLRDDPEIMGEMVQVVIAVASALEEPRNSAPSIAALVKGSEVVKISRADDWFFIGIPAKRKLAWIHESALPIDPKK